MTYQTSTQGNAIDIFQVNYRRRLLFIIVIKYRNSFILSSQISNTRGHSNAYASLSGRAAWLGKVRLPCYLIDVCNCAVQKSVRYTYVHVVYVADGEGSPSDVSHCGLVSSTAIIRQPLWSGSAPCAFLILLYK